MTHLPSPGKPETESGNTAENRRRLILDSALDAIVSMDATGRVLDWNRRAEALFGWTAEEVLGRPLTHTIIPPQYRAAHDRGMKHFLKTEEGPILNHRIEITALRRDGTEFPIELTVAPGRIGGEWIFSSFIRDLTEKKASENRLLLQSLTAGILAEAATLEKALGRLLDILLEKTPWEICGFWTQESQPDHLQLADMRCRPDGAFLPFLEASRRLRLEKGAGIPGRAQASGKSIWTRNQKWDEGLPRRSQAIELGLRTALGVPVYLGENLLGVLEFYSRADLGEDPEWVAALVSIGRQLGQYLERKRAEENLKRREQQLEIIMDAAPALISYIGADNCYRFNNRAYEEWFGYSRAEIIGKPMWEVIGKEAYEGLKPKIEAALAGHKEVFEGTIPYKEGGVRYVRGHYLPHSRDGVVEGFVVFIVDLSERRKIEEALLEKEGFLESIYNGAEEAIFVVDVTEDGRFVFFAFNPAYLRLTAGFGVDMKLVLGKTTQNLRAYLPEAVVASLEAKYSECALSKTSIEFEDELVLEGKSTYWITRLAPLLDEQGRTYRLIGTASNITRQMEDAARIRTAEDQLRQSQKMEAIGRLAGGIAHDFNNLLTAINGFSELAMQSMGDPKAVLQMLGEIKRSGERATRLTSQLLAFSRKQILLPRVLELNSVVSGMDSLLRRIIGEDIDLVTVLGANLKPVRIDPNQLEQVILNLAINARDAMPEGGRLTLETFAAEVGDVSVGAYLEARPGSYIGMAVSDTGTGMSPEIKERLFEPFFTTKEPGKGTGMGLATVYGIVNQSGGHIHVYSEMGKGSSFKVYLPAVAAELQSAEKTSQGIPPLVLGHGESILLVEDEDVVKAYAQRILEGLGYQVHLAAHGKEALAMAGKATQSFDLLLTDVIMPGMSGRDLWEKLKLLHPGLLVLFMSGYTDNAIVHHGELDEDAPFLPKPFSPAQLAGKVSMVLSGAQKKGRTPSARG